MPKNALFLLEKNAKNRPALGAPPSTPLLPTTGGFAPRTPTTLPPLRNPGYATVLMYFSTNRLLAL